MSNKKPYKKYLCTVFVVNLLMCLTAFFFSSMEVFLSNYNEFCFPARHVCWIMLLTAVLAAVLLAVVESLLPRIILSATLVLDIAFSVCFYIQSLFLNGSLQEMTGEKAEYSESIISINAVWWVVIVTTICLISMLILKRFGEGKLYRLLLATSAALIIIQLTGLISTGLLMRNSVKNKDFYLSKEGEFELSEDKNFLFFILDTCDLEYVNAAIEADPGVFDEFTGFIGYPDAISMYSRTYPSLPYLLTGEKCYFDIPASDYLKAAYENSAFLQDLDNAGVDIRLYTSLSYLDVGVYNKIDNITEYNSKSLKYISVSELIKSMLHLGGYRVMPYFLKPVFTYALDPINRNVLSNPPESYYTFTSNDFSFYDRLMETDVRINNDFSSAFRLYHLFGPHPGCFTGTEGQYDPYATQTDSLRGDIYIINEYIHQLKELGIYDNTSIIVTADHGNQNENEDLVLHQPPCCIMLLKRAGSDSGRPLQISDAHVSHEDLFATVLSEFGIETDDFSLPLYEHENDYDRVRTYYYTAQRSWGDGEVALKEYRVSGDARNFTNWSLTGNEWDIHYSQNAVAKNK